MSDVIGLVLPFFGLIFLGFLVARITRQSVEALGYISVEDFHQRRNKGSS